MVATQSSREGWSSRSAFILAAVGSAVGLGNLWRFPAEAGTNGGGAFVIFYILCVVLIGLPSLLSEVLIGRHGQGSASESVVRVARDSGASEKWVVIGDIGMLVAFLILSFYSVLGGWVLNYIGVFAGDLVTSPFLGGAFQSWSDSEIEGLLPALLEDPVKLVALHAVFMAITIFFVARGVTKGIEFVATFMMPAFFLLFLAITIYGAFTGAFAETLDFLFTFEPEKLTGSVMLAGLGQAFFSLSLGSAIMITYGAYADRTTNLASTSAIIAGADTSVALIAGLCIFPIVFAAGFDVAAGPTLMFQTLPAAFSAIPVGSLVGLLFFVMVFFAALTSSVALLEAPVVWGVDRFGWQRQSTAIGIGLAIFILGTLAALSFNVLADWHPLGGMSLFANQGFFDVLDTFTAKVLLPVAALLTAIFTGWKIDKRLVRAESGLPDGLHKVWMFLIAYVCPVALAGIFIVGIVS
ncbi:sodium-dependent transporter [Pacificimonas flava]|uniref:Sodium-dependent transporter n=2 Tax=Pacificimonas TaxID=1960290 RepID=A0A219B381_9SPHN|nr:MULTISPECIES: sodium-dependent transporter [Pacificimonas]MBZ6377686.1 sodium-dependent transporter [Pacificimonas aurantium]OWV32634.1 sodium-dependent transporter [Pacificimonas flava]